MFKDQDILYAPRNLFIWFLLAFQGGALNVGGFLGVHRFVSHVTGFATLVGVEAVGMNWGHMFGMMLVPLFFLVGVMLSSWYVERRRILNQKPKYTRVFKIIIFVLLLIIVSGKLGWLGEFGEPFEHVRNFVLLFGLCFVCGLQNALISSVSGNVIRTSHLTGPTTDVGIGLIRIWTLKGKANKNEIFALWCRMGIIGSFIFGSVIGAILYNHLGFLGFILPLCISIFVALRLSEHQKSNQ